MIPRWKRAGPNGEVEVTIKGQRYKIEKALDHNERHKGEYKIMMWDKRRRDWEWDNTVQGKGYAKELVMDKLDENFQDGRNPQDKGDSVRHGIPKKASISALKKIRSSSTASKRKKQLAHWQINMRKGKAKNEEAMTAADAGIPHDTANMGPSRLPTNILRRGIGKPINVTDRRRRKDKTPILLKKFRKYIDG